MNERFLRTIESILFCGIFLLLSSCTQAYGDQLQGRFKIQNLQTQNCKKEDNGLKSINLRLSNDTLYFDISKIAINLASDRVNVSCVASKENLLLDISGNKDNINGVKFIDLSFYIFPITQMQWDVIYQDTKYPIDLANGAYEIIIQ